MATLKTCTGACFTRSAFPLHRSNVTTSNKNTRSSCWKPTQAAVKSTFHLPMRSYEMKNRTCTEDIKCLRLITTIKTPYLPDGRFDLEAYDALVNMKIESQR
ncbi:hypothetical protein RYX36_002053 [Vicia faba]